MGLLAAIVVAATLVPSTSRAGGPAGASGWIRQVAFAGQTRAQRRARRGGAAGENAPRATNRRRRGERPMRGMGRSVWLGRALKGLDLSAEQRRSVLAIRDRSDERMRGLGRRALDGRRQLEEMLYGASPDIDRARAVARELGTASAERARARTEIELEVLRTLTPEQRARLRTLRAGRQGARGAERLAPDAPPESPDVEDPESSPTRAGRPGRSVQPFRALDLTPEQRKRLRELRRRLGPSARDLSRSYREVQRAIDDALLAESIDEAHVRRLAGDLERLEADRVKARFEIEAGIRSILTAEQATRFNAMRSTRQPEEPQPEPDESDLDSP